MVVFLRFVLLLRCSATLHMFTIPWHSDCSASIPLFRQCSSVPPVFRVPVFRSSVFRCSWIYRMPSLKLENTNEYDRHKKNLIPAEHFLLKIKVCEKLYEFLYDTGSQFSIIKRSVYDDLPNKPPLHGVTQCGIGTEGSKFIFDGVVYLNLELQTEEGHFYNLEYEPVFVSSQISTNIYGMKKEERFKSCLKDYENLTLVYSPRVGDENITIKFYKEKVSSTTAYVQIAKSWVVDKGSAAVVESKICHFDKEKFKEIFMLENAIELDKAIYTEDIKLESPSSVIKIPVYNELEDDKKLCKNDTVAKLTPIMVFEYSQQIPCGVQIDEGIDLLKERSDLSTEQTAKFKAIVENYVKDVDKDKKSKIHYEHELKLRDDEPVVIHARRLPYS